MINIGLGSLVSILLLVAGILLLMNRRMGRTFSNAYGIYTILRPACVVVAFVLWPQFREIPDQDGMPFDMISVVWFSMIYPMIYPVLLLIFINRPRVKAALH